MRKEYENYLANVFWIKVFDLANKSAQVVEMSDYTLASVLENLFAPKTSCLAKDVFPPYVPKTIVTSLLIFHKGREEMLNTPVEGYLDCCSDIAEIFCAKCAGFESLLEYIEWYFVWFALVCSGCVVCDPLMSSH